MKNPILEQVTSPDITNVIELLHTQDAQTGMHLAVDYLQRKYGGSNDDLVDAIETIKAENSGDPDDREIHAERWDGHS